MDSQIQEVAGKETAYTFKFVAPLIGFHTQQHRIGLSNNFEIRKISEVEKESLEEAYPDRTLKFPIRDRKFVLTFSFDAEKPERRPFEMMHSHGGPSITDAITVLRLFKTGQIGFDVIYQPLSNRPSPAFSTEHIRTFEMWTHKPEYFLSENEPQELSTFFSKNFRPLDFGKRQAFNWFNKAYHEPYLYDKLIDFLIALENLYTYKDEPGAIAYKMRMRIPVILSNNQPERNDIHDTIKTAYGMRSKYIHGGKPSNSATLREIVSKLENYVRKSLQIYLKDSQLLKPQNVDRYILSL